MVAVLTVLPVVLTVLVLSAGFSVGLIAFCCRIAICCGGDAVSSKKEQLFIV